MRALRISLVSGALLGAVALLVLLAGDRAPAPARARVLRPVPYTRYSLAHACVFVRGPSGHFIAPGAGALRMQPSALGQYLLYGRVGQYVVDGGGGTITTVAEPSPAALWRVDGDARRGFTMTNAGTGMRMPVRFVTAGGCVAYPEAQVNASGRTFSGPSPAAGVLGTVESHAHITALELFGGDWHCGSPFSPYGAPYALPADCSNKEQGTNGAVEASLDFGSPNRPSDFHGWPTFKEWPSPTALAEEGDYYTGIERAWKAGLRVLVNNLVDNEELCGLMTTTHNPCNDMASAHIQSRDLYGLQNYVDAQSGGPGRGWFRIVTDPFQARRVINQGKLAVIEGIEVSRIFGCGEMNDVPECGKAQVDAGLREVEKFGVRTFFPVHEFDNAFGGTKGISGETGLIVNAGNRKATGSFWTMEPCPAQDQDAEQVKPPAGGGALGGLLNGPVSGMAHGNPLPVYGDGPQCNTRGLTDLGAYLIKQMIKQHLIIQTDHMSSKTAKAAVAIASAAHYSGIVSAHCCSSPQLFKGIYGTGGFVDPPVSAPAAFVSSWKSDKALRDRRFHFGFGYGSDENGLAEQPGPSGPITYPFKSYDGRVTFRREVWGERSFDFSKDGLANYGMYADWLREVQQLGGRAMMADMFQGAEGYLEMWERAVGVHSGGCLARRAVLGKGALRLGVDFRRLLLATGQPVARPGRAYRYCVAGGGQLVAVFDSRGRVATLVSDARGYRSAGRGLAFRHGGRRWIGVSTQRRAAALQADERAAFA